MFALLWRFFGWDGSANGTPAVPMIDNRDARGIANVTRAVTGIPNVTRAVTGQPNATRGITGRPPNV